MKISMAFKVLSIAAALLLAACSSDSNDEVPDSSQPNNTGEPDATHEDTNTGEPDSGDSEMGPSVDQGVDMNEQSPWSVTSHPCAGNRTDALFCDDGVTCFVGCGTTTSGDTGFFATSDGGATWAAPTTTPEGFFDTARVNSIWRGAGSNLFVGGSLRNDAAVVEVSDTGEVSEVFTRGTTVDFSFTVGTFRRAETGFAIAESSTGVDLVYREEDSDDPEESWSTGRGFWDDGDADDVPDGVQILDMEVYDGEFWAVGSTINQPPFVFTPKWTAGDFDFNIVQLATGIGEFTGELWGIDVNSEGVVVGGVDQNRDVGMIYSLDTGSDETDASAWTAFDVSTIFDGASTWITDVCRASNDVIYATGRESAQSWGFVLRSTDGGTTFEDITPYDGDGASLFKDVSRCHAFDALLHVAGADGLFASFTP